MTSAEGARSVFAIYTEENQTGSFINDFADVAWTDNYTVLFQRGNYFVQIRPGVTADPKLEPSALEMLELAGLIDETLI